MKPITQKSSLLTPLFWSFFIHFAFTAFTVLSSNLFEAPTRPEVVQIDFTEIEKAIPETEKTKLSVLQNEKQIVDQSEKSANDEVDPNTKYLSRNNQVVQKQTVAKNHGQFQNSQSRHQGDQATDVPRKGKLTLDDLKPKMDFAKSYDKKVFAEKTFEAESEILAQEKWKKEREKQETRGIASNDAKRNAGGKVSQTLDYIKELDAGMETMLTTKEFVFYSYYSRIREQLNQYYNSKIREKVTKIYQQGRNIASTEDKITKLLVTLDAKGHLLKVQIIGISGVREIDEAAVETFKAAQPFLNPPSGMRDEDGNIKVRWDFILET